MPELASNKSDTPEIFTMPRVVAEKIVDWDYLSMEEGVGPKRGEAVQIRAEGSYICDNQIFPCSLHITVPPGHPVIPVMGDLVRVTIQPMMEQGPPEAYDVTSTE